MDIKITYTNKDVQYFRGKVWKLIPLFQSNNLGLTKYLKSLIYEFEGSVKLISEANAPPFKSAIGILIHLHEDSIKGNYDFLSIRKEIFNCSDLIKKSFKVVD